MTTVLAGLVSGCSTSLTQAEFRGQKVFVGQSTDAVEKSIGSPDYVSNNRYSMLAAPGIDPWVYPGTLTIEWVYIDRGKSLIVWFDFGHVRVLWLVETTKIESLRSFFGGNYGKGIVDRALAGKKINQ